jgi:hypothetical protein
MDSMSEEFLKWLLDAFGFTSDFVVSTVFLSSSFIIGAVGGVVQKKEMLEIALAEVHKAGLDEPLPLRYTNKEAKVKFISQEVFSKEIF